MATWVATKVIKLVVVVAVAAVLVVLVVDLLLDPVPEVMDNHSQLSLAQVYHQVCLHHNNLLLHLL